MHNIAQHGLPGKQRQIRRLYCMLSITIVHPKVAVFFVRWPELEAVFYYSLALKAHCIGYRFFIIHNLAIYIFLLIHLLYQAQFVTIT